MIPARYIVAVLLLFFSWKGASLDIPWPPASVKDTAIAKPPAELMAWAEPLRAILPKMLPKDRAYLSSFYDATTFVLLQDGQRSNPIISDTEKFSVFHAGSLNLAIEKANVGRYPGLDKAIDAVFFSALGAETAQLDKDRRTKLLAACSVLAYVFKIGGE